MGRKSASVKASRLLPKTKAPLPERAGLAAQPFATRGFRKQFQGAREFHPNTLQWIKAVEDAPTLEAAGEIIELIPFEPGRRAMERIHAAMASKRSAFDPLPVETPS